MDDQYPSEYTFFQFKNDEWIKVDEGSFDNGLALHFALRMPENVNLVRQHYIKFVTGHFIPVHAK